MKISEVWVPTIAYPNHCNHLELVGGLESPALTQHV